MFEFEWETDNSVKFPCLLCLPKKNVSAFANSPSNLRKHVEERNTTIVSIPCHHASWLLTHMIPVIILVLLFVLGMCYVDCNISIYLCGLISH